MFEGLNAAHLVSHYGYLAIFGLLAGGMVGLPLPDETIMVFTGYLVSIGSLAYFPTVTSALIGSLTGITFSFFVGKKVGYPLIDRFGRKIGLTQARIAKAEKWFERFGKFALPIGYFVPGVRHVMAYFAGISRMCFRNFALYAYTGGLFWVLLFVSLGWVLGENGPKILSFARPYGFLMGMAFLFMGGLTYIIYRVQATKKARNASEKDERNKVEAANKRNRGQL